MSMIYEAIVAFGEKAVEAGKRPNSLRMCQDSLDMLADEGHKPEKRAGQSDWYIWVLDTPFGMLRVFIDNRLGDGQFIMGMGIDV